MRIYIRLSLGIIVLLFYFNASAFVPDVIPTTLSKSDMEAIQKISCDAPDKTEIETINANITKDLKEGSVNAVVHCTSNKSLKGFTVKRRAICDNFEGKWSCYNKYVDVFTTFSGKNVLVIAEDDIAELSIDAISYLSDIKKLDKYFNLEAETVMEKTCSVTKSVKNSLNVKCGEDKGVYIKYTLKNGRYHFSIINEYERMN